MFYVTGTCRDITIRKKSIAKNISQFHRKLKVLVSNDYGIINHKTFTLKALYQW